MNGRKRLAAFTLAVLLAAGVGFVSAGGDRLFTIRKNFTIFGELYKEVATEYVDEVDPAELMRTGIEAMLNSLDPYTVFIDRQEKEKIEIMTEGSYGGVGLSVGVRNGEITVISPIHGYSAYYQGVEAGDVIIRIDSVSQDDLSMSRVQSLLRGQPGTTVELQVNRPGIPHPLSFRLTRRRVKLENVTFSTVLDSLGPFPVGYIRLERFARQAPAETRQAIMELQNQHGIRGLILDLRNNPGGLLKSAVEVADLLLDTNDEIVSIRGRKQEKIQRFRSRNEPVLGDLPLAILLNESSASASEIVAGAVQDLDRGIIVGERSFGKGLVQVIKSLPYNTSLKLTVSRYYTPSGRSIQSTQYADQDSGDRVVHVPDSIRKTYRTEHGRLVKGGGGIKPDIQVSDDPASELERNLERKTAFFLFGNRYAALQDTIPPSFQVSDSLYRAFQEWTQNQTFSYETEVEKTLNVLSEQLSDSTYNGTQAELEALRREIADAKSAAFNRHEERIKEQLRQIIIKHDHGKSGQIRASLGTDKPLQRSIQLLQDTVDYHALLTP